MGSYHLNNPNAAGESQVTLAMAQPVGDAATAEAPAERAARRPGRPSRIGVFRRLDIEIDQTDCEKIEQMKSMLGVRSTVDVIRHALRVLFFLASQVSQGYEVVLVHENKRKQFSIKMI
jgi:hypothetical protein